MATKEDQNQPIPLKDWPSILNLYNTHINSEELTYYYRGQANKGAI